MYLTYFGNYFLHPYNFLHSSLLQGPGGQFRHAQFSPEEGEFMFTHSGPGSGNSAVSKPVTLGEGSIRDSVNRNLFSTQSTKGISPTKSLYSGIRKERPRSAYDLRQKDAPPLSKPISRKDHPPVSKKIGKDVHCGQVRWCIKCLMRLEAFGVILWFCNSCYGLL